MTMPAGTYYVGDLCYVMNNSEWDEICKMLASGYDLVEGEFTLSDGRKFAMYGTAYGDGSCLCTNGDDLGVDSGSIGCIKLDDLNVYDVQNMVKLGTVISFEQEFETSNNQGIIRFGTVEVDTVGDDEDGPDAYEYEWDAGIPW